MTVALVADHPDLVVHEDVPFEASLAPEDLVFLRRALGRSLQTRGSSWVIARTVGHLALPSGRVVRIRSKKAPSASVLAWTAYVDPLLGDLRVLGDVERATQEADVAVLAARLFLTELARVIGAFGLARAYQRSEIASPVVRGRINFHHLALLAGDASRVPCITWERRPHSPAMRMLAATLEATAADPVMRAVDPGMLHALRAAFGDIVPDVSPALLMGRSEPARNERCFLKAIALARLVLRHLGLGEGERERGLAYLVGLDLLFERAVVRALRENGVHAIPKHPVRNERVNAQGETASGVSPMELDAFCPAITPGGLVVDAKYKDTISSGNLQQILAYCFLTGARQGLLAVPAALVSDKRSYRFKAPAGNSVTIHVVEFDVHGRDIVTWRAAATSFAERVRAACNGGSTTRPEVRA